MTTARQKTIERPGEIAGTGLHSGAPVTMRVLPGDVDAGLVFRRTDLPGSPEVHATLDNVVGTDRGTTIGEGESRVQTVEHFLAAVSSLGIDNLVVEMDGPEPPAADGSARDFLELLRSAGATEQANAARRLTLKEPLTVREGDAEYVVTPSDGFDVSTTIHFDHPLIGRQFASFRIDEESFARDVAPARTFGFAHEVEALRARGLAQGGSPENAVVLTESGLMEGTALRFPDEFARHKVLDIVGDLALLGGRLNAHVVATRPSHRGNIALAKEIRARAGKQGPARPILSIEQILQYLPHRYPFLLVDRVIEFEERKRIVGLKNVTINEPFFIGHFPGHPIMPGVLIIEAMAQVGGLLVMEAIEDPADKIVYFMSLDNVKWRRPVTPGDQIRFEVDIVQIRGQTARMKGLGIVDGQVVAEAEMMARIVDR
jgi:UDP-3-O-[3-hydroxymyristoyl] N-acetylglucosamine deacetylase / 3-hydroxyacyl-[acyl-carrier-protein] dehydratase